MLKDKRAYDRRHRTAEMTLKEGDKVQVLRVKDSSKKGGKMNLPWMPQGGFYIVQTADNNKHVVTLKDPLTNKILSRKFHYETLRLFTESRKRSKSTGDLTANKRRKV